MSLTRRTLLQQTSLAFASLGLSQMGLSLLTRRYQRVLATPTPRKLALLVGVNDYPESVCGLSSPKGALLQGALTDVELYQELLVSRFSFHPSDIVTLTDQQATREGIETAFHFHLLEQVNEGDVVVFCFSGLGSSIQLSTQEAVSNLEDPPGVTQYSLVPVDGHLPTPKYPQLNDLTQTRLSSLLSALKTQNLISIFDVGFSHPQSVSNALRVRSRSTIPNGLPPELIPELQERLSQKGKTAGIMTTPPKATLPGMHLAAANPSGLGVEASWDGFSAGLFSYALTQQLWWATPSTSINILLGQVSSGIKRAVDKQYQPLFKGRRESDPNHAAYSQLFSTAMDTTSNADGVILDVPSDRKGDFHLWIAGLPAIVLEYCVSSSYGEVVDESVISEPTTSEPATNETPPSTSLLVQMRSRTGLVAKAKIHTPQRTASSKSALSTDRLASGMFVYERVRAIPKDIDLVVALDNKLERIERVDATSALSTLSNISSATTGGKQPDCVFGRNTMEQQGYGLFRLGNSLIPKTIGPTEEAVKTAIRRVIPYCYGLLADKLFQLTLNQGSSCLGAQVTLEITAPHQRLLSYQSTPRAPWPASMSRLGTPLEGDGNVPILAVGHQVQCQLQNDSDRPLYGLVLRID
ncbi:MAG: caspase family protein, partial [Merismopedia sp. SIO2A8]|nr:caspase family protein [Merismopedia sp. SIO2A8]